MQRILLFSVLVLALVAPAAATEYLVNGDFEQAITTGWVDTANNVVGSDSFARSDTFGQPTPGYAAKVYKTLAYFASLRQTVDVPDVYLALSFDGRFKIGGGSSTCWPVASVWVRYMNSSDSELGNTRFYLHNQYCSWAKSDTVSLIPIADTGGGWHTYTLKLWQELGWNLPGINRESVAKVTIDLYAYDNGT
ncbi:MAG TPA: hypothetical protein VMH22_09440 [bacterium]|nr:hypothetical protein [bacterium]